MRRTVRTWPVSSPSATGAVYDVAHICARSPVFPVSPPFPVFIAARVLLAAFAYTVHSARTRTSPSRARDGLHVWAYRGVRLARLEGVL